VITTAFILVLSNAQGLHPVSISLDCRANNEFWAQEQLALASDKGRYGDKSLAVDTTAAAAAAAAIADQYCQKG